MDDIELPDAPASPESFNGLVDEKVLAPWGEAGPAPVDHCSLPRPRFLGARLLPCCARTFACADNFAY